MGTRIERAVGVYRREGLGSLAGQTARYLGNQSLAWLEAAYWRVRGVRPVTVGDTTARFGASTLHESREIEFLAANERPVVEALLAAVRPDDVLWDVGAHVGFYACFAGRAGCDVVAFEPYPPNVDRLRRNLAVNGVDAIVREHALTDERGTASFDHPDGARPGWSRAAVATDRDRPPEEGTVVRTETGDGLIDDGEVSPPTLVKIDVEGAEGRVIEGMRAGLASDDCRLVICEIHRPGDHRQSVRDYGDSAEAVRDALTDLGFTVEVLHDREVEVTVLAEKR